MKLLATATISWPATAQQAPRHAAPSQMPITTWFSLDQAAHPGGLHHSLIVKPVDPNAENIIVYASRRAKLEAQWRADIAAGVPSYEASQSDAAQRLYAPDPVWGSDDEKGWTSRLKDALGACGTPVLGAQISCPNLP